MGEHIDSRGWKTNSLSLDAHSLTHILTQLPPLRTHPHLGASLHPHLSYDTLPLTAPARAPLRIIAHHFCPHPAPALSGRGSPRHTPPARPRPRGPGALGRSSPSDSPPGPPPRDKAQRGPGAASREPRAGEGAQARPPCRSPPNPAQALIPAGTKGPRPPSSPKLAFSRPAPLSFYSETFTSRRSRILTHLRSRIVGDWILRIRILPKRTTSPGAGQEVQTENVTVAEGGVAEITCRLHQYDGSIVVIQNPARQTLFFNGTRALKDERFQLEEFSPRRVRIRLSDARLEDEGGYFCQLYTEDTHHQIATLTVLVAPENPIVEVREQAVEGGEVELSCLVPRSRPAALLRWYRDRKELKGVTSGQENGKVWSVASTVRFRVDRKDDGGIVICEAQNQALPSGHSKQTQYVLDVQYSPTARIHASQAVVREGDTLVLTCAVTGNPRPNQIRWNRGNESLPERAEAVGETLTLPGLVSADNGTYTCEASNKHGHARALYVLVVYDPGAVVEAQTSVPYAIVGGILALLVFLIICVLVGMVWCSVRQKGSYLTHEASGLDEQGEAREAFLNGSDGHKRKEEFFI
nr:cell adhesion molecule 4 [Odocoileus virginianus texanus]